MDYRKLALIIVGVAITGRLFVSAVQSFVEKTAERTRIAKTEAELDIRKVPQVTALQPKSNAGAPRALPPGSFAPHPAKAKPVKLTKKQARAQRQAEVKKQKQEKTKKEQARRKKRRQKLQTVAKATAPKTSEAGKVSVSNAQITMEFPETHRNDVTVIQNPQPAAAAQPGAAINTRQAQIAYWIDVLTNRPTVKDARTLFGMYQGAQIPADDYYKIMTAVSHSKNPASRKLVMIGCSIQPAPQAFIILADASLLEPDYGVQQLALKGLALYENIQQLDVVYTGLATGDLPAKIQATEIVNKMAIRYGVPGNLGTDRLTLQKTFSPFVAQLTALLQDPSQDLRTKAQTALNSLNLILSV
jgi:hypothetical protein